jgi:c-di-GMP-binding flagellar brake protein YcgR
MKREEKEDKPRYGTVNFERRKYPRINIDLPIEYYRIDSPDRNNGRAINASEGGLLIYFSGHMEIGQRVRMKLHFASDSSMNTIEMLAEVVWIDIQLDTGRGDYRCGVRFVDISSEDMTKMKNFLRSLSE